MVLPLLALFQYQYCTCTRKAPLYVLCESRALINTRDSQSGKGSYLEAPNMIFSLISVPRADLFATSGRATTMWVPVVLHATGAGPV